MGRSGRLFLLLRPYAPLFGANLVATFVASVMDGATFVLLIPFLRTLFGHDPLNVAGGSAVERLVAVVVGPLFAAGSPGAALRNVVLVLVAALVIKNVLAYLASVSSVAIQENVVRDLRVRLFGHLQTLPLDFFQRTRGGQLLSRVINDTDAVKTVVTVALARAGRPTRRAHQPGQRAGRIDQAGPGVCGGSVRGRSLPRARQPLPQGGAAGAALRAADESGERGVRGRGDRPDLRGRHPTGARAGGRAAAAAARGAHRFHRRGAAPDVARQVRRQLPHDDGRRPRGSGSGVRSARSRLRRRRPAGRGACAVRAADRVSGRVLLLQRAGARARGPRLRGAARAGGGD